MAGKIMYGLFSSVYFRVSIFILLCFFAATWYVNTKVEKEAEERVNAMTADVALNNIQIITSMLDNYEEKLSFIKIALIGNDSGDILHEITSQIQSLDSSITSVYFEQLNTQYKDTNTVYREVYEKGGQMFFKFTLPLNTDQQVSLLVSLIGFHDKVAATKHISSAYITIIHDNIYLYHPDEKRIGTKINTVNTNFTGDIMFFKKDTILTTFSDYLNIPVYSYYNLQDINGQRWIFTANLPNLGLSDSIRQTANHFLIISLLAICSFLAVFSLGILRWRQEVVRRREFEQQNMNLLLKNEQHKQAMITAELERLKSGLNPHFLFNSLSSLRVLITKDANVAKYFAITLSNLYRYMLKQENQNTVTLREELEFTENYINLQKIRFSNKIVTDISLPEEYLDYKVLPISLQLLVENCIKHTRISDNEPLNIRIFIEDDLLIVVNNYNPREPEADYSGKGIDNLIKRYSFLTKTECSFGINQKCYFAKIPILPIS